MPALSRRQQQTPAVRPASTPSTSEEGSGNAAAQDVLRAEQAEAPSETPVLDAAAASTASVEVRETIREEISGAPDPYGAWNGVFGWESRFGLVIDPGAGTCTIVVRIHTGASEEVRTAWERSIESKWGGRFTLHVAGTDEQPARAFRIGCDLQWVEDASDAHYEVTANAPGADADGRAGLGGTTSMLEWGTADTVDVAHEFGHMLGAVEDYFVTNGEDHTHGGERTGFRDEGGGIMNNPADDPFAEHYELVRRHAARALGVDESRCTVR